MGHDLSSLLSSKIKFINYTEDVRSTHSFISYVTVYILAKGNGNVYQYTFFYPHFIQGKYIVSVKTCIYIVT